MTHVFVSGGLALDFVGTLKWRRTQPEELLLQPEDLRAWFVQAGVIDDVTVGPADLLEARSLREHIYSAVTALQHRVAVPEASAAALNDAASRPLPLLQLHDRRVVTTGDVAAGLAAIAHAAIDLARLPDTAPLKECAAPACTRIFLDRSPGSRRSWCGMNECGSRAKVAAFRQRQRQTSSR